MTRSTQIITTQRSQN